MDQAQLDQIRARLRATSDQPFQAERTPTAGVSVYVAGGEWKPFTGNDADVEFLIHAKQDVQLLLGELDRRRPVSGTAASRAEQPSAPRTRTARPEAQRQRTRAK